MNNVNKYFMFKNNLFQVTDISRVNAYGVEYFTCQSLMGGNQLEIPVYELKRLELYSSLDEIIKNKLAAYC